MASDFDSLTLGEIRTRFITLQRFHDRMCSRKGPRQWEALAINYSLRIQKLEEALRDAAAYITTDNSELKVRTQKRLLDLLPAVEEDF